MIHESGELWIGANRTPPGWRPIANTYESVRVIEAQVGGTFCHHPALFGVAFDVPASDPLAELGNSYYGTDLPGHWNDEYSTGLDVVIDTRARLRELDLDLDAVCYFHLAEAYVPLDAERAWIYALRRGLKLVVKHDLRATEFVPPQALASRSGRTSRRT